MRRCGALERGRPTRGSNTAVYANAARVAREYRRLVEEYTHLPISSTKFPILTA